MDEPTGAAFAAKDLVDHYRHRPPYAAAALDYITDRTPATDRLLDLGCGEGKVARAMTGVFGHVTAVDPSDNMIGLGRTLDHGQAANLHWITATAETAPLDGTYDAVTFASSIHWMAPETLFPKLAQHLKPAHILAVISGDTPHAPPWEEDWQRFLKVWVPKLTGQRLNSDAWVGSRTKHLPFVTVQDAQSFVSEPFQQTVAQFILCQHSRATFAFDRLGPHRDAFQDALTALLSPYANADGMLTYRVKTDVTLATL